MTTGNPGWGNITGESAKACKSKFGGSLTEKSSPYLLRSVVTHADASDFFRMLSAYRKDLVDARRPARTATEPPHAAGGTHAGCRAVPGDRTLNVRFSTIGSRV